MSRACTVVEPVLVKIGGAAITDKSIRRRDCPERLSLICAALAGAHKPGGLVLVHGAGSFGHFEARDYRLNSSDPVDFGAKTTLGIASCRASLALLHARVLDALITAGVPAVSSQVFPAAELLDRGVAGILAAGLVPVLHGDVVLLQPQHLGESLPLIMGNPCRVVGGDEIVARLAALHAPESCVGCRPPQRAVFITGVAGVFTDDPARSKNARLIHRIEVGGVVEASSADLVWEIAGCSCRIVLWGGTDTQEGASGVPSGASETLPTHPTAAGAPSSTFTSPVADVTGGIQGKLTTAVGLVRDWHRRNADAGTSRRFIVSVSGPEETGVLGVLCNAEAPTEAVLATRATHVLWVGGHPP